MRSFFCKIFSKSIPKMLSNIGEPRVLFVFFLALCHCEVHAIEPRGIQGETSQSILPSRTWNAIQQHQASWFQKLPACVKVLTLLHQGAGCLELMSPPPPPILRFERRPLTCFTKSRQCLCQRLTNKPESFSPLSCCVQCHRAAGTPRSLSWNRAATTVAEVCRHTHAWARVHTRTHTLTLAHRRGTYFHQHVLNSPRVPGTAVA